MDPEVRRLSEDDWEMFRSVRLRALEDAPDAFGVTLAEAAATPEAGWRARATGPGPTLVVVQEDTAIAMAGAFAPDGSPAAYVWGMWVEPLWRGRGVGDRLLGALVKWIESEGREAQLHVTVGNDVARRFYESRGFVATGECEPLRVGSDLSIEKMVRR